MSKSNEKQSDWPAILLLLVGIPIIFTYGGVWVGLFVVVVGVVALGWSKRHEGAFPTNRDE